MSILSILHEYTKTTTTLPKVNQLIISQPQIANHEQEVHSSDFSRPGSPPPFCVFVITSGGGEPGNEANTILYSTVF